MKIPRALDELLLTYRIGDPAGECRIYSGEGSKRHPGRWNNVNEEMIYTSEHYSTAMLEKLVRTGKMPANQPFIEIDIPSGTKYEVIAKDTPPGWYDANCAKSKAFGSAWLNEQSSAALIVPSVIARVEHNVLINPNHPDADRIEPGFETPI